MKSAWGDMPRPPYAKASVSSSDGSYFGDYLEIFLVLLMTTAALLAFSLLLPDTLASVTQEYIGWGFCGAVALMALLMVFRLVRTFPDR